MRAVDRSRFGDTPLPPEQRRALKHARRLQVFSIVYLASAVALVAAVMGSSQAMKAAWIEDCLGFLPPLAFLLATRSAHRPSDDEHPYGRHRAVGAAHLAASVALLAMGSFLVVENTLTLVRQEHPTIGTMHLAGHTVWLGWLMIGALVYTGLPPVVLGRLKVKYGEALHDKVLYADGDMNKADWMTAGGAMLGVLGIGFGLWWADAAVALFIATSIVKDGWTNLGNAVAGLLDRQARTYDDAEDDPCLGQVQDFFDGLPWVDQVAVRMRDEGHVFHTEVLVVPVEGHDPTMVELDRARRHAVEMDWKLADLQVVPVTALP